MRLCRLVLSTVIHHFHWSIFRDQLQLTNWLIDSQCVAPIVFYLIIHKHFPEFFSGSQVIHRQPMISTPFDASRSRCTTFFSLRWRNQSSAEWILSQGRLKNTSDIHTKKASPLDWMSSLILFSINSRTVFSESSLISQALFFSSSTLFHASCTSLSTCPLHF